RIPVYWTGMRQPPNSMRRAPSARWISMSAVSWRCSAPPAAVSADSATPGSVILRTGLGGRGRALARGRAGSRRRVIAEARLRDRDEVAFGLEAEQRASLREGHPAHGLEL